MERRELGRGGVRGGGQYLYQNSNPMKKSAPREGPGVGKFQRSCLFPFPQDDRTPLPQKTAGCIHPLPTPPCAPLNTTLQAVPDECALSLSGNANDSIQRPLQK